MGSRSVVFKMLFFGGAALLILAGFSFCFGMPLGRPAAGPEGGQAGGGGGLRGFEVHDSVLNMKAFTVNAPADWKFVGVILRPGGCYGPSVPADGLSYTALAPDGVTATMQLPGASWSWASDGTSPMGPKCAPIAIDSAVAYLLNIAVPHMHPTAQILGVVPLTPQMQQGLQAQQQQLKARAAQTHMIQTLDTGRVRIEYVLDGRLVQEQVGTVVTCMGSEEPAYPTLHRPARTVRTCMSHGLYVKRALKGQLDQLVARNLPNAQIDQEWDRTIAERIKAVADQYRAQSDRQFQEIQKHYQQVTSQMLANGQRFNDNLEQSTQHALAADRAQQDAIDHAAHQTVLFALDRQDFIDPNTGKKIETSNQYMHNWISSDGSSVMLNNDSTYNPNVDVQVSREGWTELIPIN